MRKLPASFIAAAAPSSCQESQSVPPINNKATTMAAIDTLTMRTEMRLRGRMGVSDEACMRNTFVCKPPRRRLAIVFVSLLVRTKTRFI